MALKFTDAVRNARMDVVNDTAGTNAYVRIYSGSPPATADTAASGTLLAEVRGNASAFGSVDSEGVLTASAFTADASANATGTAGWFRLLASDGTTAVMDGTVTATGGGGDLTLDNTSITSGQEVTITSFVLTEFGA